MPHDPQPYSSSPVLGSSGLFPARPVPGQGDCVRVCWVGLAWAVPTEASLRVLARRGRDWIRPRALVLGSANMGSNPWA